MKYLAPLFALSLATSTYAQTPEQRLNSATEIDIKENVVSVGKSYSVLVNDKLVAVIEGRDVNWWEDRFVLKTIDGKVLASEREHKRVLSYNRSASIYDGSGKLSGFIAEECLNDLFSMSHIFHIFNAGQTEIGKTDNEAFSIMTDISLYDASGNIDYRVVENVNPITDSYTITVRDRKSAVPLSRILLLTCIEDAISDAVAQERDGY